MTSIGIWIIAISCITQGCVPRGKPIDPGFSYAASMLTEIAKPVDAKALSGRVFYGAREGVPEALVEVLDEDGKRIKGILTDEEGRFCFGVMAEGTYTLRISKPQFDTVRISFVVSRKAKNKMAPIQLRLSS